MKERFKGGDQVSWNSEAGRVTGTIVKVIASEIEFKGYIAHASEDDAQRLSPAQAFAVVCVKLL